jgi:hypothetical protein
MAPNLLPGKAPPWHCIAAERTAALALAQGQEQVPRPAAAPSYVPPESQMGMERYLLELTTSHNSMDSSRRASIFEALVQCGIRLQPGTSCSHGLQHTGRGRAKQTGAGCVT